MRDEAREEEFNRQRAEYEQSHDAQMADMYKKLEQQMIALKDASITSSSGNGVVGELRSQLSVAKQQLLTLKNENTQMRATMLQHGGGAPAYSSHEGSQKIVELENYIVKLESSAEKGILFQVMKCIYSVTLFYYVLKE